MTLNEEIAEASFRSNRVHYNLPTLHNFVFLFNMWAITNDKNVWYDCYPNNITQTFVKGFKLFHKREESTLVQFLKGTNIYKL